MRPLRNGSVEPFPADGKLGRMTKSRKQELWEKAEDERRRCERWLLGFIRDGQSKTLTKTELRDIAVQELKISKSSFDSAWTAAIEATGRYDWYEPLRRKPQTRS